MGIFDYFSKKMWRHSESVDTQKEQDDLLLERLKQVESAERQAFKDDGGAIFAFVNSLLKVHPSHP